MSSMRVEWDDGDPILKTLKTIGKIPEWKFYIVLIILKIVKSF